VPGGLLVTRSIDRAVGPDSPARTETPDGRESGAPAGPDRREVILDAVTFAAERFMAGDPIDIALPEVLRRIGTASGAGRVVLIERVRGEDGSHMRPRAEWDAEGVLPLAATDDLRGVPYFARWERELAAGHLVAGRLRAMPDDERVLLEADGVGSIVVTPLTAPRGLRGHGGYDDAHEERQWTGPELDALRA